MHRVIRAIRRFLRATIENQLVWIVFMILVFAFVSGYTIPHSTFGKPAFGEMALFSKSSKRTATVKTTSPSVLGIVFRDPVFELCNSDMEIGYRISSTLAAVLCERQEKANQVILNLTTALSFVLASG